MNRSKSLALFGLLAVGLALALAAGQSVTDKVVDPVCGMTITKSQAKATFEYQGETYYFCSTGCQDRFAKEPEKYLAKMKVAKAGAPAEKGEPMPQAGMGMQHGQTPADCAGCPMMRGMMNKMGGMRHGRPMMSRQMGGGRMMMHHQGMMAAGPMMCGCGSPACPLLAEGVERKIEKTPDGVVIKLTAKDPELVKKIQAHVEQMAAQHACAGECGPDCPMKKAEAAKEIKK